MAAKTNPSVHMGTISGGEAREIYAENPVILLPMGSHEDQGPHAPMGDYLLAEKIAELAAIRATERGVRTLVAPVLPFGGADWFGPMVGGIAISQATLTAVIADMVDSLHRNGLTRLIVINGHGGNVGPISDVARELYQREEIVLPSLYLWRIAYGLLPQIVGAEKAAAVAGHGADPLTSPALPKAIRSSARRRRARLSPKSSPRSARASRRISPAGSRLDVDTPARSPNRTCDHCGTGDRQGAISARLDHTDVLCGHLPG